MRADGYPVEAIAPQGAIYLSVRIAIPGQTNEATRQLLLTRAGLAVVPVPGVRPARGQRLVPHLGRRRLARRDRRRLPAPAGRVAAPLMLSRNAALAIGLAILLRLALFAFAENKHGDAPMRALIAERMVLEPASAAVPRTYCQFGPLHTTLMRPFIALDPLAPRSSRYLSLLAGIAVLFPFLAFARRLVGQPAAELATFALAVSPLHLQASTTAASEALYLLLWVCALERLLAALAAAARRRSPSPPPLRSPGCSRRSRPSRATTRGSRCRSSCSRRGSS